MFLTQEDIQDLTGFKNRKNQIKWLRENGINFLIAGDGRPRVLHSHIESLIGATSKTVKRRVEPNFSKFEKTF